MKFQYNQTLDMLKIFTTMKDANIFYEFLIVVCRLKIYLVFSGCKRSRNSGQSSRVQSSPWKINFSFSQVMGGGRLMFPFHFVVVVFGG